MTNGHPPTPRIVVGVDGSASSTQALEWAIRHAESTGGEVSAVTAWEYPQFYGSMGWMPPENEEGTVEQAARKVLADSIADTAGPEPAVTVHGTVAYGAAAPVLLKEAEGASLLVVGSRGHGGFAGALLGSVGQHCVQHAPCPVVVVRGHDGR